MKWALSWAAVVVASLLYGWWIERAERRRIAANEALRGQIESLSDEEERLVKVLQAHWRRQCELLDEYDAVWGLDRVKALPSGERLAGRDDVALLEAILSLPAYEPERRA